VKDEELENTNSSLPMIFNIRKSEVGDIHIYVKVDGSTDRSITSVRLSIFMKIKVKIPHLDNYPPRTNDSDVGYNVGYVSSSVEFKNIKMLRKSCLQKQSTQDKTKTAGFTRMTLI
jgi:hypothetical protein